MKKADSMILSSAKIAPVVCYLFFLYMYKRRVGQTYSSGMAAANILRRI